MQKDCFNRIQINWMSNKNNGNHQSNLLSALMRVLGSSLLKNSNTETFQKTILSYKRIFECHRYYYFFETRVCFLVIFFSKYFAKYCNCLHSIDCKFSKNIVWSTREREREREELCIIKLDIAHYQKVKSQYYP